MLCLRAGQCLGKHIRSHVVGWAVDEFEKTVFDNKLDEVVSYVDVLGTGVKVAIGSNGNGGLIVTVKCSGLGKR